MEPNLFRYIWRHSRRDQLLVLALIVMSLPFYFASFDVPKRIINDALQGRAFAGGQPTTLAFTWSVKLPELLGGRTFVLSEGLNLNQMQLLMGLSLLFLTLVVINGAFKYAINLSKGILGERMLRRMRFELFALLLRFRPEDIRAVKPAEAASIIKDEVEPIGGFTGDAFIQPAFLGMQALTALTFIMVQSFWLGLVALSVVLIQAFVIPRLRREQLRLARERQIASRKLAGRIGEVIEGAPAIHVHGIGPFTKAEIGDRLGALFTIRADLFRRKFAVKYLNNFLAQITPFFFYSIGGYLALKGSLDIGQLVAVIAAYRDLPPPIKELIDWDQERADVTVKYQQIVAQFPSERLRLEVAPKTDIKIADEAPIRVESLKVTDQTGVALLESASVTIRRPGEVALVGSAGSGRDILAKVLGRQITAFQGRVLIDGVSLPDLPDQVSSTFLSYAGPDPLLFSGTIRDNVAFALRRREPIVNGDGEDAKEKLRRLEAKRSGNPLATSTGPWLDLDGLGVSTPADLDGEIMRVLGISGLGEEVYRLGLLGRIDAAAEPWTAKQLLEARHAIIAALGGTAGMSGIITPFDPQVFNPNATLAENLLFGLPIGERFAPENLPFDAYARSILETESLLVPLARIGVRMAETAIELFADLPQGHPLFDRFSFIAQEDVPEFRRLVETSHARGGVVKLNTEGQAKLIGLSLSYVEPRHRMGVVDDVLRKRVLRARASFKKHLPQAFTAEIGFYDPDRYVGAAPIRDNLLFGRVSPQTPNAEDRVQKEMRRVLSEHGLESLIHRVGLDHEVGPGGKLLFAPDRAAIAIARALIARPKILVMDNALAPFGPKEARAILSSVRAAMAGRCLIVTLSDARDADGFDQILAFERARLAASPQPASAADAAPRTPATEPKPEPAATTA